jgi:MFS family permease
VRGLLLDLGPLRSSPAFRRLWAGQALSTFGGQMTLVAVMYQVWQATHSPLWSGAVGVVQAVPMVAVGLWGGALVDRSDRRRIVLVTSVGQLACSAALAAQALWRPGLAAVLVLLAGQSAMLAVGTPATRTFTPRLLPPDQVAAGIALTRLAGQASMLAGPALGGLLIGLGGTSLCYSLDAVSFAAGFYGVLGLPSMPPLGEPSGRGVQGLVDGLRFVLHEPVVRGAMLIDLAATVLAMPVSLFPLVNQERFGGDPRTLGLFLTAIALGGVGASAFAGAFTRLPQVGVVMVSAAACWGLALAAFGVSSSPWWGLGFLAVAGAADSISVVSRGTLVQLATPDHLRGRISSVEMIVGVSGPDLGNLRAGASAQAVSAGVALMTGGVACVVAVAATTVKCPEILRFGRPPPAGPRWRTWPARPEAGVDDR